jgi:hypothetical protein
MQTEPQEMDQDAPNDKKKVWVKRLKSLGIIGILFFFIKGLVWLAIFYFGASYFSGCYFFLSV